MRLRASPANREYREKVRAKKNKLNPAIKITVIKITTPVITKK
ncbi:MAG TPA: hypothetical protein VE544_04625 [Nitrososphaeraceae archaeon]|nr:hypothetical protein [Nitrososphaeraceae archaeon]